MKWLLATLNNLNRVSDFEFKHVQPNNQEIENVVDSIIDDLLSLSLKDDPELNNRTVATTTTATSSNSLVSATSSISPYVQKIREKQNAEKPSLARLLSKTICEITENQVKEKNRLRDDGPPTLSKKQDEFEKEADESTLPSDRSWESSLPKIVRDRARALRLEFYANIKNQEDSSSSASNNNNNNNQSNNNARSKTTSTPFEQSVVQTAYETKCVASDRDVLNYLGVVLAVDFRHWISGTRGDEISKLDGCWCRCRSSPVLPCPCQIEARENQDRATEKDKKVFFETDVKQMWNKDLRQGGKLVRGSSAMVSKMRDIVDTAAESDPNKFWFRPNVMIRRLLQEEDGKYELIDDLFTGLDETGTKPLQFPAASARIQIMRQIAEFYQETGKDFYDLVVESRRRLIGDAGGATEKRSEDDHYQHELRMTNFLELPGLLPSLCRSFPRFYDIAVFSRNKDGSPSSEEHNNQEEVGSQNNNTDHDHNNNQLHRFVVAQRIQLYNGDGNVAPSKFAAPVNTFGTGNSSPHRRRVIQGRPYNTEEESKEMAVSGKQEVTVLFMKLAQLFAVAVRSCRRLFCSKDLKWLRDDEPFLDEEENLTIASDYQIPNALRFGNIITYSEELQIDVDARRILPATSLKEVEIRLVSVLASTALRLRFRERIDHLLNQENNNSNNNNGRRKESEKDRIYLIAAREVFTTAVLDYCIWLFGRSLTTVGLGCHHLTPGLMY